MKLALAAATGLLVMSNAALASDPQLQFSARVGPSLGMYAQDSELGFRLFDANGDELEGFSTEFNGDDEPSYGIQTGFSSAYGDFFTDIAIEYQMVDTDTNAELDRTDILVSAGSLVGDHLSFFAGYRRGMQGDGAFNDDTFSESGLFVGAGVGGMSMGPIIVGSSVAYNLSEAKDFPQEGSSFLYKGISVKLSASLASLPAHSLQLRYQRFNGDDTVSSALAEASTTPVDIDEDGVADGFFQLDRVELTETYIQLTYLYSFGF
ncbi:MAG: hypothetical protein M3O62_12860 [Pseudomonadota bacterium]|nr:hypothetical protein [Pseudomonadota bacterium]